MRERHRMCAFLMIICALSLSLLLDPTPALAQGPVCRVDKDVAVAGVGDTWANAYRHLQDALTEPSCTEIWVAAGVYYPDDGTGQTNDDPTSTFQLQSNMAIYGGFAGDETSRDQRDWESNITVLSGDIDHETLSDHVDANGIVTHTTNITGTNAYHVLYADGTDGTVITTTTKVDGVTVTAGLAITKSVDGGGFYCDGHRVNSQCSPTFTNVTFSANFAQSSGGAMRNAGYSSPMLTNVRFIANSAAGGGAMYNSGYSSPTLTDVTFIANSAGHGGAIYNYGGNLGNSSPMLTNVLFTANSATLGGAMYNDGDFGKSSPTLINTIFTANSASSGGAIYNDGGHRGSSNSILINVTFVANSAGTGGAIYNYSNYRGKSSPTLINTILWGNNATQGHQLYNHSATPLISHTLIQNNSNNDIVNANSSISWGDQILTSDPRFVDADGPDNLPGTKDDDLRLQGSSPAIDAGLNLAHPISITTDLAGNPRIQNGRVDLGAYEMTPTVGLQVRQIANVLRATIGDVITYTYRATNGGAETLTLAAMDDKLGNIPLTPNPLAGQATATAVLTYTITADDLPSPLHNQVTVTGTASSVTLVTQTASATVLLTVNPAISLTVDYQGPTIVIPGTVITYHVAITNVGGVTVTLTTIRGVIDTDSQRTQRVIGAHPPPCQTPLTLPVAAVHRCTLTWTATSNAPIDFRVIAVGNAYGQTFSNTRNALIVLNRFTLYMPIVAR